MGFSNHRNFTTGYYALYLTGAGKYLCKSGKDLTLGGSAFPWSFKELNTNRFNVYAGDTDLMLDIHNAYIAHGNTVKLFPYTGYDVQVWSLLPNGNGTYAIVYCNDHRYCLGFSGGKPVLLLRRTTDPMQAWNVVPVDDPTSKNYCSYVSQGKTVEIQLSTAVLSVISATRLQQWARDMEKAYDAFSELTGYRPYSNLIIEAYKPITSMNCAGYAAPHSNVIHIDSVFLQGDLRKMAERRGDWNFCALHEMGHIFDFGKPWTFEPEFMTDLKVAYVMEKYSAAAAPAEFAVGTVFRGKEIINGYRALSKDLSAEYQVFACVERFLRIKERIGWDPFKNTFRYLNANAFAYEGISNEEKFRTFVDLLSRFSGQEVKDFFSQGEWNSILRQCRK